MNRDNALFAVIGLLVGFIAGYLLHEVMAARQPPRLPAGQAAAGAAVPGPGLPATAAPGVAPGAPPGGPSMEEIQRLRDYVAQHPEDADAVLLLANLNYDIRSWDRARELYEQYLGLRPNDPDVLTDLGVALRGLGQHQEALARFDQAQGLAADHWQSMYNEAVVLAFDLDRLDEAQRIVGRLQELQPANEEVQRLAAEIGRRSGAA